METNKDLELLKRHCGEPGYLTLKNKDGIEDKIKIPVLPYSELPRLWSVLMSAFGGEDSDTTNPEKLASNLFNAENLEALGQIMKVTLKKSFPDADEELLEGFISSNYMELLNAIIETNMPTAEESPDSRKSQLIRSIQAKQGVSKEQKKFIIDTSGANKLKGK